MDRLSQLERIGMVGAAISTVWMVVAAARSENPQGDLALVIPILVSLFFGALWGVAMLTKEGRQFGSGQVVASIAAVALGIIVLLLLTR